MSTKRREPARHIRNADGVTLCHPCHKRVTAELAARLAKKKRAQLEFQIPDHATP